LVTSLPRPLVVTAGEPAGIGPDLCVALGETALREQLVIVGDPRQLLQRSSLLGVELHIQDYDPERPFEAQGPGSHLRVLAIELPQADVCGTPHTDNAVALMQGLGRALDGCIGGEFSGLVTGPLQKSVINDAGISFSGHTEYLAERAGSERPVMLLVSGELRVALASTHIPLREVPGYITTERLTSVIDVLERDLTEKFGIGAPEILVCGLNPHAGEGGHLGSEDREIIAPAVREAQARGANVRGPLPADSAFTPAAGHADVVLAMYHDQGLPVLKYASFGQAVNVTLGLPIIRTSVDHGTALDLAGRGTADAGSMFAAVELAANLASR
jgi:4-hydroxythreonine-4-phosphate dehydrogenase